VDFIDEVVHDDIERVELLDHGRLFAAFWLE
jgi:hypothetical protein